MKLPRPNQKGMTHILAPLIFIVLFAVVGSYVLVKSKAATVVMGGGGSSTYTNGSIYSSGYTMNSDGSDLKALNLPSGATQEMSNMSFGGGRVAYWAYDSTCNSNVIYKGTISDSSITNVSTIASLPSGVCPNSPPMWSPDGTKVAARVTTPTAQRIWVAKANGSNPHLVPNVSAPTGYHISSYISWVPGSGKIMYALTGGGTGTGSYNSKICTITTDGYYKTCNRIVLPDGVTADDFLGHTGLAVSPTGNKVALATVNFPSTTAPPSGDIYTINPNGTGLKRLTTNAGGRQVQGVVWSPDGKKIAYLLTTDTSSAPSISQLWIMDADGNNGTLMHGDTAFWSSLSWAHQ